MLQYDINQYNIKFIYNYLIFTVYIRAGPEQPFDVIFFAILSRTNKIFVQFILTVAEQSAEHSRATNTSKIIDIDIDIDIDIVLS